MNELWPNVVYVQYPLPPVPPYFFGWRRQGDERTLHGDITGLEKLSYA